MVRAVSLPPSHHPGKKKKHFALSCLTEPAPPIASERQKEGGTKKRERPRLVVVRTGALGRMYCKVGGLAEALGAMPGGGGSGRLFGVARSYGGRTEMPMCYTRDFVLAVLLLSLSAFLSVLSPGLISACLPPRFELENRGKKRIHKIREDGKVHSGRGRRRRILKICLPTYYTYMYHAVIKKESL